MSTFNISYSNLTTLDNFIFPVNTRELNISYNNLTNVSNIPTSELKALYINNNNSLSSLLTFPITFSSLTKLNVSNCGLNELENIPHTLTYLDISHNYIIDIVTPLTNCTSLQTLYANNNQIVSINGLQPSIRELNLANNFITSLLGMPPYTQILDVHSNTLLTSLNGISSQILQINLYNTGVNDYSDIATGLNTNIILNETNIMNIFNLPNYLNYIGYNSTQLSGVQSKSKYISLPMLSTGNNINSTSWTLVATLAYPGQNVMQLTTIMFVGYATTPGSLTVRLQDITNNLTIVTMPILNTVKQIQSAINFENVPNGMAAMEIQARKSSGNGIAGSIYAVSIF